MKHVCLRDPRQLSPRWSGFLPFLMMIALPLLGMAELREKSELQLPGYPEGAAEDVECRAALDSQSLCRSR